MFSYQKKKETETFLNCFSQFFILLKLFPMNVSKTSRKKVQHEINIHQIVEPIVPKKIKKKINGNE